MPNLIYTDDAPKPKVRKPRRKKYPKGKHPRPLTGNSKDVKLLRLPWKQQITVTEAAEIIGIHRNSFRVNYLYSQRYSLPDFIEMVRDMGRIVGIKRVGP